MNVDMIRALIEKMPDGSKKSMLQKKLDHLQKNRVDKRKGANGLNDTFNFDPKGHIKIEAIDSNGAVVETLQDKDNLVVNGADEIAIKALAGDPGKTLYRNRTIKPDSVGKINNVSVYIDEKKLNGQPIHTSKGILHEPNVLWNAVDENDFISDFAYYPNTLFIKEEISTEPGKKLFTISEVASSNNVPLTAEIYSTYTNLFIGLGDGKQAPVQLDDKRLVVSGDPNVVQNAKEITSKVIKGKVTFKAKVTRFALTLEKSNKGGQVEIAVNGIAKETIDTLDSSLVTPENQTFEFTDLDDGAESTITITLADKDEQVTEPVMKITRFECDALDKTMNSLMSEFKNTETKFLTPTSFNTEATAPYSIEVPHYDVIPETLTVQYEGIKFERVELEENLAEHKFMLNEITGEFVFDRALSNVLISYEITGKVFDRELVATMTAGADAVETITTETEVVDEVAAGVLNGLNQTFQVSKRNLKDESVVVTLDGEVLEADGITSIDLATGRVVLVDAPLVTSTLTFTYTYITVTNVRHSTLVYGLAHEAEAESIELFDEDGVAYEFVESANEVMDGKFTIDQNDATKIIMAAKKADGESLVEVSCLYTSLEVTGIDTNYRRAVIMKPKSGNEYPWFSLDKGVITFVAEFPEESIKQNVTIREMGLFDGPRVDDGITGFYGSPVKPFSLVRSGETLKDANTGIRVTWTIKLTGEDNKAFTGGNN